MDAIASSGSVSSIALMDSWLRHRLELQRRSFDLEVESTIARDAPYYHPRCLGEGPSQRAPVR